MLEFNNCPYRNKPYMGPHSEWVVDLYQKYFGDITDGFLVEIGVGCVLDWQKMGTPKMLDWDNDEIIRGESHTLELLENGWTGIYIESIHELITNELDPLLQRILPEEQYKKIKMVKCGASDKKEVVQIYNQESLKPSKDTVVDEIIPYNYQGRKLFCDATSIILNDNECPFDIDFMLIDVEGYEVNVLNGLDFSKHRPKLMLIEISNTPFQTINDMISGDYVFIRHDGLNAMFVHKDFSKE